VVVVGAQREEGGNDHNTRVAGNAANLSHQNIQPSGSWRQ
jgi:hypothetical protein